MRYVILFAFTLVIWGCDDPAKREVEQLWNQLESKLTAVGKVVQIDLSDIHDFDHTEEQFLKAFPEGTKRKEIKERLSEALKIDGVTIHEEDTDDPGVTLLSIQMSVDDDSLIYFVSFQMNELDEVSDISSAFSGFGTIGNY